MRSEMPTLKVPVAKDEGDVWTRVYLYIITGDYNARIPKPSSVRGFVELLGL